MRVAIVIAAMMLTGCNTAIVITIGAHKNTQAAPLISKTSMEQPCPTAQVIVKKEK